MTELNDDWLHWPPDSIDGFFDDKHETDRTLDIRTAHDNKTYEESRHGNTWYAFFS